MSMRAVIILLTSISLLLYDRMALLPARVAKAAQEAMQKATLDEMHRRHAETTAIIQKAIRETEEYCKKHPEKVTVCGSSYKQRK